MTKHHATDNWREVAFLKRFDSLLQKYILPDKKNAQRGALLNAMHDQTSTAGYISSVEALIRLARDNWETQRIYEKTYNGKITVGPTEKLLEQFKYMLYSVVP